MIAKTTKGDIVQTICYIVGAREPGQISISNRADALVIAARTRPKFVGGARAVYDESLL